MDTHPYHKIETLFERDDKFVVTDVLKNPLYGSFKTWHVTEKIDGTNIRVILDMDGNVNFAGRTDNAQFDATLYKYLQETFTPDKMQDAFWITEDEKSVKGEKVEAILYGEGYGAGIQKGGVYNKEKQFRLFDVLVAGEWWLGWDDVVDVANKLDIKTVPYCGDWTLEQIVANVKEGVPSNVALEENGDDKFIAEGIVGRTVEPLFDKRGNRVILKLKTKDFG